MCECTNWDDEPIGEYLNVIKVDIYEYFNWNYYQLEDL